MLVTVGVTTVVWVTVTFLTAPESDAVLDHSTASSGPVARVGGRYPGGSAWATIVFLEERFPWVNWVAGVVAVYTALFGVGAFLTS